MYPHPELNSYLQGYGENLSRKVLNRAIDQAMHEKGVSRGEFKSRIIRQRRLASEQPQCYAPHVDVTRANCAYGELALPILKRDLKSEDALKIRQAVTTIGDLIVDPTNLIRALEVNIQDELAEVLSSSDPYLRERGLMICATMANQAAGRDAIRQNLELVANLAKCMGDRLAAVRLRAAITLENLAFDYTVADQLIAYGFMRLVTERLAEEKRDILVHHLGTMKLLLYRCTCKSQAIEVGTFDRLTDLLRCRKDREVLRDSLSCLTLLCEDHEAKIKAICLLDRLKALLNDEIVTSIVLLLLSPESDVSMIKRNMLANPAVRDESLNAGAAQLASFISITTPGKRRFLDLLPILLHMLSSRPKISRGLLLPLIKTLTNLAEVPEGRRMLLACEKRLEKIQVDDDDEILCRHKCRLLEVIRWVP